MFVLSYSVNKVVKYGLRHAVKRHRNRQSVHKMLEDGFQDFIVAGIVMEYLPIQTQNKIECWKKSCRRWGCNCWQCSLIDDRSPFHFDYCPWMKRRSKKYVEAWEFVQVRLFKRHEFNFCKLKNLKQHEFHFLRA